MQRLGDAVSGQQLFIFAMVGIVGPLGAITLVRSQRQAIYTPRQLIGQSLGFITSLVLAPYVAFRLAGAPQAANLVLLVGATVGLLNPVLYGILGMRERHRSRLRDLEMGILPHAKRLIKWEDILIPGLSYAAALALSSKLVSDTICATCNSATDEPMVSASVIVSGALIAGYAIAVAQRLRRNAKSREHELLVDGFAWRERHAKKAGYKAGYRDGFTRGRNATHPPDEDVD